MFTTKTVDGNIWSCKQAPADPKNSFVENAGNQEPSFAMTELSSKGQTENGIPDILDRGWYHCGSVGASGRSWTGGVAAGSNGPDPIGLVGAFVGGWLFTVVLGRLRTVDGLAARIVAFIGAVILLAISRAFTGQPPRRLTIADIANDKNDPDECNYCTYPTGSFPFVRGY